MAPRNTAAKPKTKNPPEDEPKTMTLTPSGIEIAYFTEPKRCYKVRTSTAACVGCNAAGQTLDSRKQCGCAWKEVPSVTTVLKCLDKPALPWWGMRIGLKGVLALIADGFLALDAEGRALVTVNATWEYATPENVEQLLKERKLTTNHVVEQASTRGISAHDAFEAWAAVGKLPDPSEHPPEEHGYLVALRAFCDDMGDAWETGGVEVAVASVEHGFAGRYDLRGTITKDVTLVARGLTKDGKGALKKGPETTVVPAGKKLLIDLKTSKSIYNTHLLQLEAYEGASIECGYEPTDARAVLHVSEHGVYQFKRARATYEDFLAILHTYHALERVAEAL